MCDHPYIQMRTVRLRAEGPQSHSWVCNKYISEQGVHSQNAAWPCSVNIVLWFPQIHLLLKLWLQRFFCENMKLHLPVAKEHSWFKHDQCLLQSIATGYHGQVHPEPMWQHSMDIPWFSRPPRKKEKEENIKAITKLIKNNNNKKQLVNGWNISKHEQAQSVIFYKVIAFWQFFLLRETHHWCWYLSWQQQNTSLLGLL